MEKSYRHIKVTVPVPALQSKHGNDIRITLAALTRLAGGVTKHEEAGEWYLDSGELVKEPVITYTWWLFPGYDSNKWNQTLRTLYRQLLDYGEEAVFVESLHHGVYHALVLRHGDLA